MKCEEDIRRRNRFYFYCVLLVLCVAAGFFGGLRLGRTLEREVIKEKIRQHELICVPMARSHLK